MGNDEQINDYNLEQGKSMFLPPEIKDIDGVSLIKYSLEDEYRKSRKNFAWKVYVLLLSFVGILGIFAYSASLYFEYVDKKKEIVVTEYEGENLKGILTETRLAEKKLAESRDELTALHESMKSEIAKIRSDGEKAREEIKNKDDISSSEKNKMISRQKQSEKNQIEAVTQKYEKLIDEKEKQIAENEKNVDEKRSKMDKGVAEASRQLSNSERLAQMRMDNQKKHYEDMMRRMLQVYDPVFKKRDARKILLRSYDASSSARLEEHSRTMEMEAGISRSEYDTMKSRKNSFAVLMKEAKNIPYKNSMQRGLRHMEAYHNSLISEYEQSINTLMESLRSRKREVDSFNHAFDHLTKINPETGYIIDPRNENAIMVYVNPVVRIKEGTRATVFRRDDETIGEIEFLPGNSGDRARILNLAEGKKLQPFDKVLIEYKR